MAINFPDSPNLNDTYSFDDKTWIWNGYGWKIQIPTGFPVHVSDSPPIDPGANTLWWQSNTGTFKIYYSDGDSTQWVEAVAIPTTLVDQFARDTANNASGSSIALAIALG